MSGTLSAVTSLADLRSPDEVSRRAVLRGAAGLGLGLALFDSAATSDAVASRAPIAATHDALRRLQAAAPQVGGSYALVSGWDMDSLDPQRNELWDTTPYYYLYDTLVGYNAEKEIEPVLAEAFEVSDDGLHYTFTIREGLSFTDGTPLDAEAVKFTFDRFLDPENTTAVASEGEAIDSVEVLAPNVVQVNLHEPFSPLWDKLASPNFGIVSPAAVRERGEEFTRRPVGYGPYMFDEWIVGEQIAFVRNEGYQSFHSFHDNKGAPYLVDYLIRVIPDAQTATAALEAGEVQQAGLPREQIARFETNPAVNVFINEVGSDITYLEFSFAEQPDGSLQFKAPLDDLRVRQAIAHAINADEIIHGVYNDLGVRNFGLLPPATFAYDPAIAEFGYAYDPERAKALLDEAGWVGSDVRQKDGQSLTLEFWTAQNGGWDRAAQVIQSHLSAVGIATNIQVFETATLYEVLNDGESHLNMNAWSYIDPDILRAQLTYSGMQLGRYKDYRPEALELVVQATRVNDREERRRLYFEAQKLMLEDAAVMPLVTVLGVTGVSSLIEGFKFDAFGGSVTQDAYYAQL